MKLYLGSVISRFWPLFLEGIGVTLLFSAISVLGGVLFGTLLSLARRSRIAPLRWIATAYVEVVRGTPLLVQLYFFYYMIPLMLEGFTIPDNVSIGLALVLNSAAYVSEIIRSGIQAVDHGQVEAARSLGMSSALTMRKIVLPQAIKNILPALANEFIMVVKESSLASTFFLGDLMTQVNIISSTTFNYLGPLVLAALIYFVLTFTLSKLVAMYERKLRQSD